MGIMRTLGRRFNETETPESIKSQEVKGRRSPRWAIWSRMIIPCRNGEHYLARLRLIQTPLFAIYLHDIYHDDTDRDPHNHPWTFLSIVIGGDGYIERVYPDPTKPWTSITKTHKKFSIHKMGRVSAHRITYAADGLKTLIITGPRRASWGFFVDGKYIDWKDYERLQVEEDPSLAVTEGVSPIWGRKQ